MTFFDAINKATGDKMKRPLKFTKMSGTGNDFIIIDNRSGAVGTEEMANLAERLCRRQFSVGADGLICIEDCAEADFSWQFFNADGSSAEMCGNGARCAARYAFSRGIAPESMRFETRAGMIEAQVVGGSVKIRLTRPSEIKLGRMIEVDGETLEVHFINTGVPHAVSFVSDNQETPVRSWGSQIRHHEFFEPAGTNVNFVQIPDNELYVRTYERGVEDETLACGTGAVASALIAALHGRVVSPVKVRTSGDEELIIHFTLTDNPKDIDGETAGMYEQRISEVFLEGPAAFIYDGELLSDAM